jgi:hypothetical protein
VYIIIERIKIMNRLIVLALTICLLVSHFLNPVSKVSAEERNTFLKVNDYYLLYTYPIAPYIDSNERFMLPLRSISELFGAKVDYYVKEKRAVVTFEDTTVELYIGSNKGKVNGRNRQYDSKPVLVKNSMIVPIRVILDSFKINAESKTGLVEINDERLLKTPRMKDVEDYDIYRDQLNNKNAFSIVSSDITVTREPNQLYHNISLTLKAKNITGADIPKGKEDLRVTLITENSYSLDNPGPLASGRERPFIKKDSIYTRHVQGSDEKPYLYVLLKARTLK